jgi:hypothetical protein
MEKSMSVDETVTMGISAMRKSTSTRMFSLLENLPSISTQFISVPLILTNVAPRSPQSKNGSPSSVNSARSGSKRGAASAETISVEEEAGDGGRPGSTGSSSSKKLKTTGSARGMVQMTLDQMLPPINSTRSNQPDKPLTDRLVQSDKLPMDAPGSVTIKSQLGSSSSDNDWTWQCSACTYVNKSTGYASTMRGGGGRRVQQQGKKEEVCAVCNTPRLTAGVVTALASVPEKETEVINLINS